MERREGETRQSLLKLYAEMDAATAELARATGLACPSECGVCCDNPRVEVTVAELLPLAEALFDAGRGSTVLMQSRASVGQRCVFFESLGEDRGRCTVYALRPSLCRLFGFAGVRLKGGGTELAACGIHSQRQPDVVIQAMDAVEAGLPLPVFSDYAHAVATLSPDDGTHPLPINQALLLALQKTALRRQSRQPGANDDDGLDPRRGPTLTPRAA